MKDQLWILLQLLFVATIASAQTQSNGSSCPLNDELNQLDSLESDELNDALESAVNSFNKNPTVSAANDVFYSAMESFPSSVTLSLYCSGYGGINLNSLPVWLSAVPTSYVSKILKEQSVYSSILSSFVAGAATATAAGSLTSASRATTSMPSSTVVAPSSSAAESTPTIITSPTSAQRPSPSPSSGGVAGIPTASLSSILLLAASVSMFLP